MKKTTPKSGKAKEYGPAESPAGGHEHEAGGGQGPHREQEQGSHGGHAHERFPTREEVRAFVGDEVDEAIHLERALIAYERHLIRIDRLEISLDRDPVVRTHSHPGSVGAAIESGRIPRVVIEAIISGFRRRRRSQRVFSSSNRDVFNRAIQKAHQAGSYQSLSAIHANASTHRIHSMQGAVGTQRFLPWHRQYLLQFENLLKTYEPLVRIPYWDYANDQTRPDWVWNPPGVTRNNPPGRGGALPTQQIINQILAEITYTGFTFSLEQDAHNLVHNWCNGTISAPPTAPQDPIFWLLHANVDRIWDIWQMTQNGTPSLKAMDWILDPFAIPASDVDSIINLGYSYS